ncbi:MAG: hypothetical protein ACOC2N_02620 [Spirochaetota bacterium]
MNYGIRKNRAVMDGSAEPWEVERRWQNGKILPGRSGALFGVVFGVGWLVLILGMVLMFVIGTDDPVIGLFGLFFLGPGIFMLARFVPRMVRERRYADVHLKPSGIPVDPGDRFQAVLYTGADASEHRVSEVRFDVRLTCNKLVERSSTSESSGRQYVRHVLWETTFAMPASVGLSEYGSVLTGQIDVDLPANQPETTRLPREREKIDWRLDVKAGEALPGFQYEFQLPVYDTRAALERADQALGSEPLSAESSVPPADREALRAYGDTVWDARLALDGRSVLRRLIRGLQPHTHLTRDGDAALSCVHVRGDRPVRRLRRGLALLFTVIAFVVAGPLTPALLLGALVLMFMGKAARPVTLSVHADSEGLQVDSVDRRKERSDRYAWSDIGTIADTAFSNNYRDIMVPRPHRRTATLGFRIPSRREAEGIAAAIAAVRDRYRV